MTEESHPKRLKQKRSKSIEVVFSDDELVALDQRRGEIPRARFLREIALNQKPARLTTYKKVDPDLLIEINRIGCNLNQIAYFINRKDENVSIVDKLTVLNALSLIRDELNRIGGADL